MVPIANLQPLRLKKDQPIGFWFKSRIIPHGCKGLLHTAVHITGQKGSFCQNNKLTGPCLLGQVIAGFFGEVLLRLILLMRHRLKFSVKFNNTVSVIAVKTRLSVGQSCQRKFESPHNNQTCLGRDRCNGTYLSGFCTSPCRNQAYSVASALVMTGSVLCGESDYCQCTKMINSFSWPLQKPFSCYRLSP